MYNIILSPAANHPKSNYHARNPVLCPRLRYSYQIHLTILMGKKKMFMVNEIGCQCTLKYASLPPSSHYSGRTPKY